MNYLAHFYLSNENENLILGNLIADSMNGRLDSPKFNIFSAEIIKGIQLHREIDSFTDNHPIVRQSIHRLQSKYHKYSGVIIDMYYDHLLARNWNQFSNVPLELYSARVYTIFEENKEIIPFKMNRLVHSMTSRDWLSNYRFEENLNWAFLGLSKRAKFDSKMEFALTDLMEDYGKYLEEFLIFFPEIIKHCQLFLGDNSKNII
ncbi:MAG: ACP phosphodiesterase [Bacteroidota bacterium]